MTESLLAVRDLAVTMGATRLVDGVSFDIGKGEIFGLVGESGSGKTLTALALMRLLAPSLHPTGAIRLDGRDLLALSERDMRSVRGGQIGMIFQEPVAALNPVFTIEAQIAAALRAHTPMTRRAARTRVEALLAQVGLPDPASRRRFYPHQLSGGQCQRVMIAMALAGGARLLIADEPTTALDVTIQEEIVGLIEQLARDTGIAVLFISHDLGLVARLCHRIAVAYAGQIVEIGAADALLQSPRHPYTQGLVRCVPNLRDIGVLQRGIPGAPPQPGAWPEGCRFAARCPQFGPGCDAPQPLIALPQDAAARCWRSRANAPAAMEPA
jgi:oligopeptide/dipeptide ABC transporter ATP-binding protein